MIRKIIFPVILLMFIGGCDNSGNQGQGMMGGGGVMNGGGMMGGIKIPGSLPPEETDTRYVTGYQQAKIICSQCHAMPHPDQHSGSKWPAVIARMKEHIRTTGKEMPGSEELQSIVNYYVGNAG